MGVPITVPYGPQTRPVKARKVYGRNRIRLRWGSLAPRGTVKKQKTNDSGPKNRKSNVTAKPHDKKAPAGKAKKCGRNSSESGEIDLLTYHERHAGHLVIDPEQAKTVFGETLVIGLKLSQDGTKVLWPQPTDSLLDLQNWSPGQKALQLFIITLASIVPDFDSGIGITAIFALAEQYKTTPDEINNLTSNSVIISRNRNLILFQTGWGGLFAVILIRRYGRLPILFWSQVLGLLFMLGATVAPNLNTFPGIHVSVPSPGSKGWSVFRKSHMLHISLAQLNIWTFGYIVSPFLSLFVFGFLVTCTTWRWAYGIGTIYSAIVCLLILVFGKETMYDRGLKPIPEPPTTGLRYWVETLLGLTGIKIAKYRDSWYQAIASPLRIVWRPQLIGILFFEGMMFGFGIGVNVSFLLTCTNAVFLGTPPPLGFGLSPFAIAGMYGTPVAVFLGEIIGRYTNDWIMNLSIRRNGGVFEAESRLWACHITIPLYICGFVMLGASFQNHLSVGGLIMGWGIAETTIMINTVAVLAYCSNTFPKRHGEISAFFDLAHVLGGYGVAYFQIPWAVKHGALQVYGVEAAIVAGLFLLVIPLLQLKGGMLCISLIISLLYALPDDIKKRFSVQ
ncbi:MFS general substrate transporter [Mycena leptocephala]|nr:MFS general substrate transporter [Mycena leptocephala]